jgi:hypothetical protein
VCTRRKDKSPWTASWAGSSGPWPNVFHPLVKFTCGLTDEVLIRFTSLVIGKLDKGIKVYSYQLLQLGGKQTHKAFFFFFL